MPTLADSLMRAVQCHQAGDIQQAEEIYRQILQYDPGQADAWHYLGVACLNTSRIEEAIGHYQQSLRLRPNHAAVLGDLGIAYANLGRRHEAVATLQQALHLQPDNAETYSNLGVVLWQDKRNEEAVTCYQRALQLKPDYVGAHNNLGLALVSLGRWNEAEASFRRAIQLKPDYVEALGSLASLLMQLGRLDDAAMCYQQVLWVKPHHVDTLINLGLVHMDLGRPNEAELSFRKALQVNPDAAFLHNCLGLVLRDQSRSDEALACFRRAVEITPDFAQAHNNLGIVLKDQGRVPQAIASFRRAAELNPGCASNLLLMLNYDPGLAPAELLAEHRRWSVESQVDRETRRQGDKEAARPGDRQAGISPCLPVSLSPCLSNPARRLRIGYVSPDFLEHPVARFLEPILAAHDHEQFEIFCYADVSRPDAVTVRMRQCADEWRSLVNVTDEQAAEMVRKDRIDILVDLAGHMSKNRLGVFVRKPAPVQVTYLGYPNTTGLDVIDYRLTDAIADPPGESIRHSEDLVRLPGTFCCYKPQHDAPPIAPLPALTSKRFTFGSLHNLAKLNANVLDLWSQVLHAVPTARLLICRHPLMGSTVDYLREQFLERGICADRLDLRGGPAARVGHLRLYEEIDVMLDTLPWSAHAVACESLWMGVPVLTQFGDRHAGRMAASILDSIGLTEWIARTPEEYITRAVEVAGDLEQLSRLREELRRRMSESPLFDGSAFTRGLETAYREMWRRYSSNGNSEQ